MTRKLGRPKKYLSQSQRKMAKAKSIAPQIKGANFRLVIPNLQQYNDFTSLYQLKNDTLQLLLQKQQDLEYYNIAVQVHPTTGRFHLDILLLYSKSVRKSLNRFDYLVKHGNLTKYRKLNQAILAYGKKEDPYTISNLPNDYSSILRAKAIREAPYEVLRQQMVKDPFSFEPHQYLAVNNLDCAMSKTNWSKVINFLKIQQQFHCNKLLQAKPSFKFITRQLIESQLTSDQLRIYDSWDGYQVIVDHLNQVPLFAGKRPFKTKQLLVVGPSHIGKTSLISEPDHIRTCPAVENLASTYHMGMKHWFPKYQSGVYRVILWDQFKLTSYSYDTVLKLLQGSPMDLPHHGGATKKIDNPLIYMTSNMTLAQHIRNKFMMQQDRVLAYQNLSYRITQVIVPKGLDLFLLRKLIISSHQT